jgi:hypothetical protein
MRENGEYMMPCPETDCREDLIQRINDRADVIKNGIKTELNDVKAQCADKVGIRNFYWIVAGFLTAIGLISGIAYTAYSRSQDQKQAGIEECQKSTKVLDTNVAVMAKDLDHIKEELEKQGVKQERILDILNKLMRRSNDNGYYRDRPNDQ